MLTYAYKKRTIKGDDSTSPKKKIKNNKKSNIRLNLIQLILKAIFLKFEDY